MASEESSSAGCGPNHDVLSTLMTGAVKNASTWRTSCSPCCLSQSSSALFASCCCGSALAEASTVLSSAAMLSRTATA